MGMSTLPAWLQPLGHDVYAIDTGYQRPAFDAAYLILARDGTAAFVDTGTAFALPRLLGALTTLGVKTAQVSHVIVTHVHLDHAGGAGHLMQALPAARLVVHPRGARHMIDPSQLYAGALAVYGQAEMDASYGELWPVPASRVIESHDGMTIAVGNRPLQLIDTPGHARHHHAIWDDASKGWFTGDTFGLSYREFDTVQGAFVLPTTSPVQFDLAALEASVARMLAFGPECLYPTHFGRAGAGRADVRRLGSMLLQQAQTMSQWALKLWQQRPVDAKDPAAIEAELEAQLSSLALQSLRTHGVSATDAECLRLLQMDLRLNAQGLAIWASKQPG